MGTQDVVPPRRVRRIESPDGKSTLFHTSPTPDGDAVYEVEQTTIELHVEVERDVLRHRGVALTPAVEEYLRRRAVLFARNLAREKRARGIAPHLVQLLSAVSKRDAERLASAMVIDADEFTALCFNARALLGYRYRVKWKEFHPDHHHGYSDEISKALRDAKVGPATPKLAKAMRKMRAMFDERKRVHAHMFQRGAKWHCFFFDLNDLTDPDRGPHMHYISHRWADVSLEAVWNAFDERHQSIPRGVHIQYREERMEQEAARRRSSRGEKKPRGGYVLSVEPAPSSEDDSADSSLTRT
jgi:hypothetical protein